ncbi:MAG: hypothetical protein NTZ15_01875 [Burkholderiales bacterium]|jgi:hypothetical protein|nr:hypothetical protein [Burkholderiales bacterium]
MTSSPPMRLRRFPLKGATPVAWQSQFHGVPGMARCRLHLPWSAIYAMGA